MNENVRLLAERFSGTGENGYDYGFICECGCGTAVPLTLAAFLAAGAWVDGHKPD